MGILVVATLFSILNSALDITYAYRTNYHQQQIFMVTGVVILIQFFASFAIGTYYYDKHVW